MKDTKIRHFDGSGAIKDLTLDVVFGAWFSSVMESAQEIADKTGKSQVVYISDDRNYSFTDWNNFYNNLNAKPVKVAHIYANPNY